MDLPVDIVSQSMRQLRTDTVVNDTLEDQRHVNGPLINRITSPQHAPVDEKKEKKKKEKPLFCFSFFNVTA